ncbi:hypothetical protein [Saccharopolyspora hattusasensis]|uniref:hypothetical protein n=1 Tax=Saccharopolyspora hattusasensis TaxID=1128679 RepID=UPI003D981AC6
MPSSRCLQAPGGNPLSGARELSDLQDGAPPRSPFDEALDADGQQAAVLAQLAALREIRELADQLIDVTVTVAATTGAGGQAIGEALNVTRSAVRKKYPDAVAGRPGPRKAAPTTYGSADWTDPPEDGAAERDWLIRARVQLRQDATTGGAGIRRVARADDTLVMVMRGPHGPPQASCAPQVLAVYEPLTSINIHKWVSVGKVCAPN